MPTHPFAASAAALFAAAAIGLCGAPAAHAACESTPLNSSFSDPLGDGDAGLAPEAYALTVSADAACQLSVGYSLYDQIILISGDTLTWFLDVDGNASTGSTNAFVGADIGVARNAGSAIITRYSTATASFGNAVATPLVGAFGAQVDLPSVTALGTRVMTVSGGTVWKSSSTGNSYYDLVPNPPAAPFPFTVALREPTPPTPPATPTTPTTPTTTTTPPASTAPAPPTTQAPPAATPPASEALCVVPRARKLPLGKVKARLRQGGCAPGRIVSRYSSSIKRGLVIELDATPGDEFEAGEKIEITVSKGPRPTKKARRATAQTNDIAALLEAVNHAASQSATPFGTARP